MKYTVVWTPEAESELARIWQDAEDRAEITAAANLLDRRLAHEPDSFGESRPNDFRIGHCLPLGIHFNILHEQRSICVLAVWECRKRR